MPPSAQIGGPLRSLSRNEEATTFTLKVRGRDADTAHELFLRRGTNGKVSCGRRSPDGGLPAVCAVRPVRRLLHNWSFTNRTPFV